MRLTAFILVGLAFCSSAGAATLAGVDVPDTAQVAGSDLTLNGVGLRKKFFIKIYVGGLYLPQKSADADAIVAAAGPDRVLMHMIYAVDKGQFADAWHDDFKGNNKDAYAALHDQVERFIGFFSDSKKDDVITMDYVPGQGTQVSWNGALRGTIPGEDFHKALLKVFLGPNPPTSDLKDGMLGKD
ncbi:MAG TPA: chalcone isomerase family protein [Gammaproteobacteria bacterium]|jgi:hypothetical protein|nr:chalcone isomerase family protein [Gammaproteobacteria bacterium]